MYASSALEARTAAGEGLIDNELLPAPQPLPCLITVNGTEIEARTGDSILARPAGQGLQIPSMCDDPRIKPTGGCRNVCTSVDGGRAGRPRARAARQSLEGLAIRTGTAALRELRKSRLDGFACQSQRLLPAAQAVCAACPAGIDVHRLALP